MISASREAKLSELTKARRVGIIHRPIEPSQLVPPLDGAYPAPQAMMSWSDTRDGLLDIVRREGPADRYLLIGDTGEERLWAEAAKTAGYISADRYFASH